LLILITLIVSQSFFYQLTNENFSL